MVQTAFGASCMNRASVFEWHKRSKEGSESVRDDESCGKGKEVRTPELIGQIKNFMDKDRRVSIETIIVQFDVSLGTVHSIIRHELKMRKISAKFVPRLLRELHPCHRLFDQDEHQDSSSALYSPNLAPCDFWLFPKLKENLRGCCYETNEEMKEAVTKVIDTLTQ